MIYTYKGKYYVNISPRIYCEVNIGVKNGDIEIIATENKVEISSMDLVDIDEIKKKLEKGNNKKYYE